LKDPRIELLTRFIFELPEEFAPALLPFLPKFHHALLDLTHFDPATGEEDTRMQNVLQLMKLARQKALLLRWNFWVKRSVPAKNWEPWKSLSWKIAMRASTGNMKSGSNADRPCNHHQIEGLIAHFSGGQPVHEVRKSMAKPSRKS
jgi:hypothetical protein